MYHQTQQMYHQGLSCVVGTVRAATRSAPYLLLGIVTLSCCHPPGVICISNRRSYAYAQRLTTVSKRQWGGRARSQNNSSLPIRLSSSTVVLVFSA